MLCLERVMMTREESGWGATEEEMGCVGGTVPVEEWVGSGMAEVGG